MDAVVLLPDTIQGLFYSSNTTARFWLYWMTTFADLLITLMSATIFYFTAKNLKLKTLAVHGRWSSPINVARMMTMCLMAFIFCRVSMDTIILLTWQEVSVHTTRFWQQMNEVFDSMALIPFLSFFYLMIRAGPVIEFQLLRQPIPTDLRPSWKMVRGPVISLVITVLLSLLVVSTKLLG